MVHPAGGFLAYLNAYCEYLSAWARGLTGQKRGAEGAVVRLSIRTFVDLCGRAATLSGGGKQILPTEPSDGHTSGEFSEICTKNMLFCTNSSGVAPFLFKPLTGF